MTLVRLGLENTVICLTVVRHRIAVAEVDKCRDMAVVEVHLPENASRVFSRAVAMKGDWAK